MAVSGNGGAPLDKANNKVYCETDGYGQIEGRFM